MVRLKGPLKADAASGTLAGAIVYSSSRGRPYARGHVIPADPRTQPQIPPRAMFKFLAQTWSRLSPAEKLSWAPVSERIECSPYHGFLTYNLERWHTFRTPSTEYPAPEGAYPPGSMQHQAVGGVGMATITLNTSIPLQLWGFCVFRKLESTYVPSFSTLVHVVDGEGTAPTILVDRPVPPGIWRYMQFPFWPNGMHELNTRYAVATVTA